MRIDEIALAQNGASWLEKSLKGHIARGVGQMHRYREVYCS